MDFASKQNKKILFDFWIFFCFFYYIRIKQDDFILGETKQILDEFNYEQFSQNIFIKNKEIIDEFYECTEDNFEKLILKIKKAEKL